MCGPPFNLSLKKLTNPNRRVYNIPKESRNHRRTVLYNVRINTMFGTKRRNMICPQCGYDMGNKNKCIRCGYENKDLAVVDTAEDGNKNKKEDIETKVIDPCNVYLTHPYGYEDDYGTGFGPFGDPFASLFDDMFGDPISDLLGGLFGINLGGSTRRTVIREEEPPKRKKKQGPIVEVNDVEIIENEPKKHEKQQHSQNNNSNHASSTHKNKFRRRPDR